MKARCAPGRIALSIPAAVLMSVVAVVGVATTVEAAENEDSMKESQQFFAELLGTRETWPDDMTKPEEKIMQEHFLYLRELVKQKKVLMAGPCFDPVFGLVILQTADADEAEAILRNDPSVKAGLHEFTLSPMKVSLMAEESSPERYVAEPSDRILHKQVEVTASLEEVWQAWTTTEGVLSFFGADARVELRPGGRYEVLFDTSAAYGLQGGEGCRVLSFLPMEMLTFEWNAPPSFGELRNTYTRVVLLFNELPNGKVIVRLSHLGWGQSDKWDELFDYFDRAWSWVLSSFEKRFEGK